MNAKTLTGISILLAALLAACAATPAATPAPGGSTVIVQTSVVRETMVVMATAAYEPTYAPAAPTLPFFPPTAAPGDPGWPQAPEATGVPPTPYNTPPADNFFRDYGVNPYVNTAVDHFSTFALDVDTASYTVARRYVTGGNIPPPEAIRVEEFVNYFEQDYAAPPDTAFSVYADGAPSPFHYDGTQILRVGVQGFEVPENQRPPAVLTFIVDVSGSMNMENRLGLVKQSLQLLVDRLRPSDSVAIVVYGTQARVVLHPTSGEDRATILSAIYGLQPEGSTNAEAGLRLGYEVANWSYRDGAINRVILCSDGVANVGLTGPEAILAQIEGYADRGIALTSVGFGMGNFNEFPSLAATL